MKKNDKLIPIIAVVLIVLLLIACCFIGGKDSSSGKSSSSTSSGEDILTIAQKESDAIDDEDRKELEDINIDTYLEFYNGTEKKLVFIGRPTCGYCQIAHPIVEKINKDYDLNIYYLNTDDFVEDDEVTFVNSDEFLNGGYGTPMLFIVSDGKIVDKVDGLSDTSGYIEFLKTNGFIEE